VKSASTYPNLKAVLFVPAHDPGFRSPKRRVRHGRLGRRSSSIHDGPVLLNPAVSRGADQPRKMIFQDPAGINFGPILSAHVKLLSDSIYSGVSRRVRTPSNSTSSRKMARGFFWPRNCLPSKISPSRPARHLQKDPKIALEIACHRSRRRPQ
jgi:hypothetical protein